MASLDLDQSEPPGVKPAQASKLFPNTRKEKWENWRNILQWENIYSGNTTTMSTPCDTSNSTLKTSGLLKGLNFFSLKAWNIKDLTLN